VTNLKGVLLAGGHGTRLRPLTYYCNKHLLPIYFKNCSYPIIELALEHLVELGIRDIAVILGDFRAEDIINYFHQQEKENPLGVKFTYFYQGEPLGIAHAVAQAKDFLKDQERFFVMLGDNIFIEPLTDYITDVPCLCQIFFAYVKNPSRFGSPRFNLSKGIIWKISPEVSSLEVIEEKPKKPQTSVALTGAYLFNTKFFFDTYYKLKPSKRGEYELTDIINMALKQNPNQVRWSIYKGFWSDAGTFQSIYEVQKKLNEEQE